MICRTEGGGYGGTNETYENETMIDLLSDMSYAYQGKRIFITILPHSSYL